MRLSVELARFLTTATTVAFAVPIAWATISIAMGWGGWSPDLFFITALAAFVLAILGGALAGVPIIWLLSRLGWNGNLFVNTALGGAVGSVFVGVSLRLASGGSTEFFSEAVLSYTALGLIAGAVAGAVWHLLHLADRQADPL